MSILIFVLILVVLILVHEFGHFIVAKRAGIRVDEFGLGYPPKIIGWKKGETTYTLNLLPFGGFVRIFGEDPDDTSMGGPDSSRSLVNKPKRVQAAVLVAGIVFNIIFAWLLISAGFLIGLPSSVDTDLGNVADARTMITGLEDGSPAAEAGIKAGDVVTGVSAPSESMLVSKPDDVISFIGRHQDEPITFGVDRGGSPAVVTATPREDVIENSDQKAIGISLDMIGTLRLPLHKALWEGLRTTWSIAVSIVVGLFTLITGAFSGTSDLSQVSGPVGIASLVGDASRLGFVTLMTFTAFISLNLAIINLIPFPALDGGRILFVAIEAVKGSRINPKFANTTNLIGFVLLLGLMAVVTFNDILKFF